MCNDTRELLHYFRLLPDGRFMFGGRGGTDASPQGLAAITRSLRTEFERIFPAWAHVETERSWAGFVCLASGLTPYAGPIEGMDGAYASLAYHGNGVAMGSYAGRLMADVMSGAQTLEETVPAVMRAPLKQFPLPALRLFYLKSAYLAFRIKDEHL
jgi:glycine/D-amino acid oxidase-like deaminating enzyme